METVLYFAPTTLAISQIFMCFSMFSGFARFKGYSPYLSLTICIFWYSSIRYLVLTTIFGSLSI